MTYDLETTIQLPDEEDVDVAVDFEVTHWGSPGCGPSLSYPGDPPEAPEVEVLKIVRLKDWSKENEQVIPLDSLTEEEQNKLYEAVMERVYEIEQDRGYDDD